MATTPVIQHKIISATPLVVGPRPRPGELARTHAAIWWLHDAADFDGLEAAARELCAMALPDLAAAAIDGCAKGIRACYEAYDAAQGHVRAREWTAVPQALKPLRRAHRLVRSLWQPLPDAENLEEGYFAFFAHSMWLHTPGYARPWQKLWRNPARLAGIWRYHRASFGADHPTLVYPAVRALFFAGLQGHDYKSIRMAEHFLEVYWTLLTAHKVRHLFF